ncbi:fungal-specific transcription factor domain-containing protein [Aspergillus varians]
MAEQSTSRSVADLCTQRPIKRRRRAQLACQECRDRKIRCSGTTPVCDSCLRNHRRCDYPMLAALTQVSARVAREQAPRVTAVQHETRRQDSPMAGQPQPGRHYGPQQEGKQSGNLRNGSPSLNPSRLGPPPEGPNTAEGWLSGTESPPTQHGPAELAGIKERPGQGLAALVEPPDTTSPGVLGRTSGAGFMEEAYQALSYRRHKDFPFSHLTDQGNGGSYLVSIAADLSMPPRAIVDHLLHTWWEQIHPVSPVLHQPTFMNRYHRIWEEEQSQEAFQGRTKSHLAPRISVNHQIFHCILNFVLAITCQRSSSQGEKDDSHEIFYTRANKFLTEEVMEAASVQLVQALILKSMYLRGAGMTIRSWVSVGTTIRVAQAVGLQHEPTRGSQAVREERKRIWYTCVLMDRAQSMTYGRPSMISSPSTISLPEPIDDIYLSIDANQPYGIQPEGVPSKTACFVLILRLSNITSRLRQSLYNATGDPSIHTPWTKQCASIMEFDAELGQWHKTVPKYLRYSENPEADIESCFRVQSKRLHCQFLHCRVLLFRRIIICFANKESNLEAAEILTPLQSVLAQGCVEICISTARELLDLIKRNIGQPWVFSGWYITSFILCSIATIFAVVLLSPRLRDLCKSVTETELDQSWNQCLSCIETYERLGVRLARSYRIRLAKMFGEEQTATEDAQSNSEIHPLGRCVSLTGPAVPLVPDESATQGKEPQPAGSDLPSFVTGDLQAEEFADPDVLIDPLDEWTNGSMMDSWLLHDDFRWMNGFDIRGLEVDPTGIKDT